MTVENYELVVVSNGTTHEVNRKLQELNFGVTNVLHLHDLPQLLDHFATNRIQRYNGPVLFLFFDNLTYISQFLYSLLNCQSSVVLNNVSYYFDALVDSDLNPIEFNQLLTIINSLVGKMDMVKHVDCIYINDLGLHGTDVSLGYFVRNCPKVSRVELASRLKNQDLIQKHNHKLRLEPKLVFW